MMLLKPTCFQLKIIAKIQIYNISLKRVFYSRNYKMHNKNISKKIKIIKKTQLNKNRDFEPLNVIIK